MRFLKPASWSLRAKLAALVVGAALVPLTLQLLVDLRHDWQSVHSSLQDLLGARAEQIAREFDSTHQGYLASNRRVARLPVTTAYCAANDTTREELRDRLLGVLKTFPASDSDIRGVSIISPTGNVLISSETGAVGIDVSARPSVRTVLAGSPTVSDVYLSHPLAGSQPVVAYLEPVRDSQGRVMCAAALYVNPDVFGRVLRTYNGLAGPGSYGVIYDRYGIRIAHSASDRNLYHPAGPMDPAAMQAMLAENRFGPETERMLNDVRPLPAHFERARAAQPDPAMYRTPGSTNGVPSFGAARRMHVSSWTVFYLSPEANLLARLNETTRASLLLALGVMALALVTGLIFARGILRPVRALADATRALASGHSSTRAPVQRDDELGQLATSSWPRRDSSRPALWTSWVRRWFSSSRLC